MPTDLINLDRAFYSPAQAAKLLGCNPYSLTLCARDEEKRKELGFPVIVMGTRVKIPRLPLLKFLGLIDSSVNEYDTVINSDGGFDDAATS